MSKNISARQVLAGKSSIIGTVPRLGSAYVCSQCLGPVPGYDRCYGCKRLFEAAPGSLEDKVVPMSTASNPGLWYRSLVNYKNGNADDHTLIACLLAAHLGTHRKRINRLVGGSNWKIVVVPSTRGRRFAVHPLAAAVRRVVDIGDRLVDGLSYVTGETIARQEYKPSIYRPAESVIGERIVLIEDL